MLLGCIADDITGATDLALMLARSGMRTVQVMGVPESADAFEGYDAVVVALKSRTIPAADAVAWSLQSCDVLRGAGARQILFKYCSTFDSTEAGNIGPVGEALMKHLGTDIAIACPAFPANARSIYKGHLFVGDMLLSDSPMKDHPLTPMRDANLVRVLGSQTSLPVGLVDYQTVAAGSDAVRNAFDAAKSDGARFVVTDAIDDAHLMTLGKAIADHVLITGGSGIAMGLADNFVSAGLMSKTPPSASMDAVAGRRAILAGSCSAATRGQVAHALGAGVPAFKLVPTAIACGAETPEQVLSWAARQPEDAPILIYSSDDPEAVGAAQDKLGREKAGEMIEAFQAKVASGLADVGFTRFVVAGGETSGAVADGLAVKAIAIGPEIDPGVPWVKSLDDRGLVLAFKSGNFGTEDFFLKAWDLLT
jgi:uncharacterized protein YgbK (DUF1537 family)